ncbi:MAG: hypothetical protein JKY11_03540 [Alphaproteobacteria bacterium]|nr:hypothetical protein [Alphaproteobacteria bacterium]
MRILFALALLCSFVPSVAWAGTNALCKNTSISHIPIDDVTYRPSPNVVPADLNPSPFEIGDIEIPLTNYLAEALNLTVPITSSKLESIKVKQDGRVIYRGRDISDKAQAVCQKSIKPKAFKKAKITPSKTSKKIPSKIIVAKPAKQHGQTSVETVKSIPLEPLVQAKEQETEDTIYGGFGQDHINGYYNE